MRLVVLTLMIAGVAAPALAQSRAQADPSWPRRYNSYVMEQDAALRRSQDYEREARAREQKARTDATLRAIRAGELAGGPPPYSPYQPSVIDPIVPSEPVGAVTRPPPPMTADAARMDELMAAALARSNARVRAVTDKR